MQWNKKGWWFGSRKLEPLPKLEAMSISEWKHVLEKRENT